MRTVDVRWTWRLAHRLAQFNGQNLALGLYKAKTRQSAPVFLNAVSKLLNEAVIYDWVYRVVDVRSGHILTARQLTLQTL